MLKKEIILTTEDATNISIKATEDDKVCVKIAYQDVTLDYNDALALAENIKKTALNVYAKLESERIEAEKDAEEDEDVVGEEEFEFSIENIKKLVETTNQLAEKFGLDITVEIKPNQEHTPIEEETATTEE